MNSIVHPVADDNGCQAACGGRLTLTSLALAGWVLAGWLAAAPPAVAGQEHALPTPADAPAAQQAEPQGGAHQPPADAAHQEPAHPQGGHEGEHEASSPWALIGKLFNFAVMAGALVYLLRSPFAVYLRDRGVQIRSDLAKAAVLKDDAAERLAQIEARMQALPGEIEALKQRGAVEIAAEESRIREGAAAERQRMLEHARREIDMQVRTAERMLQKRAAELAVDVATERVKRTITAADQSRLVDRYLGQVGNRA